MELLKKSETIVKHLAGIVPVAAPPLEFNMPWNDSLIPISPDYLAVERAAYECVLAGCKTIWIVCHYGIEPLIRKRIGDFLFYPTKKLEKNKNEIIAPINVFYVPIHPKDRDKRDSLGYSVLYGADSAFRVCSFLSKWIAPERYYCAFPYGVSPSEIISDNRSLIISNKKVIFSYKGKTIKDGIHASFTFDAEDYKRCRDIIKNYVKSNWELDREPTKHEKKTLHLGLKDIFLGLDTQNSSVIEYPWFYNISSWAEYSSFIGSGTILVKNTVSFGNKKREDLNDNSG